MATKTRNVTRRQAAATVRAIEAQFKGWVTDDDRPMLFTDWDEYKFVVIWESGSPYDWPQLVNYGGVEEEFGFKIKAAKLPAGVWVEPVNNCVLAIFPKDW